MSVGSTGGRPPPRASGALLTARVLAKRFGLPLRVAQEIEMTAIWRAARRSWMCWSVLVLGLAGSVGLVMAGGVAQGLGAVLGPMATGLAWRALGRTLAAPAMLAEATRRSASSEDP